MTSPMYALTLDTSPEAQRRCAASIMRGAYYHHDSCWVYWTEPHAALLAWGHRRLRAHRRKGEP